MKKGVKVVFFSVDNACQHGLYNYFYPAAGAERGKCHIILTELENVWYFVSQTNMCRFMGKGTTCCWEQSRDKPDYP